MNLVTQSTRNRIEVVSWSAPTVAENLAIDESLAASASKDQRRTLRFWRGGPVTAVLGCAEKPETALNLDECNRLGIDIVKRVTGGGAVLQSPGVFNYSYTAPDGGILDIHKMFQKGAELVISALSELGIEAHHRGISDVAVGNRKISGNAQARKWHAVLLHGTLLFDMDSRLLESVIMHPTREPDYRQGRLHSEFIVTLKHLNPSISVIDVEHAFQAAAHIFEF
jgi:lipoate-protein ligase A